MPHVSCMYPIMYPIIISDVSRMYLDHLCRYLYPECILHVSCMYLASQLHTSLDTFL